MAHATTPSFLADLPDLVTPEVLASKLGVKTHTIYQRIWRQKQKPESTLLPEITVIPGSNRVAFVREVVIEWWIDAQTPTPKSIQITTKKRGRPTIAEQLAGHLSPLSKVNSNQSI